MLAKTKIRLLPIVIFMAVLTLSIRITDVYDQLSQAKTTQISFGAQALAEEQSQSETQQLSQILDRSDITSATTNIRAGSTFTQSEIAILQELAERREALDLRNKEIDKKVIQLKVTEEEINKKLAQLQAYEKKLRSLMQEYSAKEKERLDSLVKLYASMKPRDAARILNTLDIEVSTALVREMKPSASSAILSQMEASKAKAITDALIGNSINNKGNPVD